MFEKIQWFLIGSGAAVVTPWLIAVIRLNWWLVPLLAVGALAGILAHEHEQKGKVKS